ncbi:hypothetical protein CPJCM30710_29020 [Clostridium polyendosporum]|uniref:Type VI secretion system spike protein VgrG3-like C-terminal domain-containing protein n=1 Tax=Clostridium polyendosporum TaxID=69208 RepID=A0A919S2M7_9CLOT|nr:hypothetical protein [Clostridium polyendosporum]GIM30236.1 hypothetical protein CPJCM30710_29020 [Clostridium polyendosporum]
MKFKKKCLFLTLLCMFIYSTPGKNVSALTANADVNGDGIIDIRDIIEAEINYNTNNSKYDLNQDGIVDIFDIAKISKNINESAFKVFDSSGKFIQGFSNGKLIEAIKTASRYKDAVVKNEDKIIWDSTGYWTYNGETLITKFPNYYDAVQNTSSIRNGKVITKFGTELLNNTTGYKGVLAVAQCAVNLRQQPSWSPKSDVDVPSAALVEVVRRTNSFYEVKWHKDESTVLTGYVPYYLDFIQDDKNNSMLGYISGKEESDFNPAAILDKPSDLGGVSCGVWQFSSNAGSLGRFMMWLQSRKPEFYTVLNDARVKDDNSYKDNFKAAWISIANNYYDEFFNIQQEFAENLFYDEFIQIARTNGYEPGRLLNHSSTRNMIWSTAIQHGPTGAYRIFSNIDSNLPMEDYIRKVYEARFVIIAASYPPDSSDPGVVAIYNGVKERFDEESAEIIRTYQREISY